MRFKMRMLILPLFLSALCVTNVAGAQVPAADMTVFGIPLGTPLTYPKCVWGFQHTKNICLGDSFPRGTGVDEVGVYFPDDSAPEMPKVARVDATVFDGKVVAIHFETAGLTVSEKVLAQLIAKYGPPSAKKTSTLQNAMGAHFVSITSTWTLPGLTVYYTDAAERIDTGYVSIATPQGLAALQSASAEDKSHRPAL